MQCPVSKKLAALFVCFFFCSSVSFGQISSFRLQRADSLFNAKQFTQSLAHYEQIFKQKEYSPAMLLKMAFVEEGLNHLGKALYYLNLYYLATSDDTVLEKMDALSAKFKLEGYELSGEQRAMSFYQKYHLHISIALAAIVLFLFSLSVYMKRKKYQPIAVLITMLIFVALLGVHLNGLESADKAIIAGENNYLREGPSGAAPVVEIINGGHRINVVKHYDVWVQIEWKGKTAFIKEQQLLPVIL